MVYMIKIIRCGGGESGGGIGGIREVIGEDVSKGMKDGGGDGERGKVWGWEIKMKMDKEFVDIVGEDNRGVVGV
jgi:hypothetical protein